MASDIGKMHFRRMDEGTDADFAVLARVHEENIRKLPDLLIGLLTNLKADEAYPIDRLQHSLQAATRDGRDEEYVVCALLHDIGESLGPFNHGEVVAAVLRPFVSEENRWMLEHHPVFQVYFYGHHLKIDENAREQYRGSPYFDRTAEFCALYDEISFDAITRASLWRPSSRWCVASFTRTGRRRDSKGAGAEGGLERWGWPQLGIVAKKRPAGRM
jgi:predicted HD phosphohydrolase